jgi:hypothetical protein
VQGPEFNLQTYKGKKEKKIFSEPGMDVLIQCSSLRCAAGDAGNFVLCHRQKCSKSAEFYLNKEEKLFYFSRDEKQRINKYSYGWDLRKAEPMRILV